MKVEHQKHVELADQRINVYQFLARIYTKEITPEFLPLLRDPHVLGVLLDFGAHFGDEFISIPADELIEDLAVEYTRLFLGPGKHIPANESIHHERDDGDWGRLWGASTVEVKKFIESAGLEYRTDYKDMPDHISVEFEFMQKIIEKERDEWKDGNVERALYCLKMEKKFIEEHIARWVPLFCKKIIDDAELPFYREIARVTKDFVEFEEGNINAYISGAQA
jgi:TorA maturation chaperone TorD